MQRITRQLIRPALASLNTSSYFITRSDGILPTVKSVPVNMNEKDTQLTVSTFRGSDQHKVYETFGDNKDY